MGDSRLYKGATNAQATSHSMYPQYWEYHSLVGIKPTTIPQAMGELNPQHHPHRTVSQPTELSPLAQILNLKNWFQIFQWMSSGTCSIWYIFNTCCSIGFKSIQLTTIKVNWFQVEDWRPCEKIWCIPAELTWCGQDVIGSQDEDKSTGCLWLVSVSCRNVPQPWLHTTCLCTWFCIILSCLLNLNLVALLDIKATHELHIYQSSWLKYFNYKFNWHLL